MNPGDVFDMVSLGMAVVMIGSAVWAYRSEDARIQKADRQHARSHDADGGA